MIIVTKRILKNTLVSHLFNILQISAKQSAVRQDININIKRKLHLFFAVNVSPRQTHSSLRRQVFPGRLKSHAVQISSVTIDGGCNHEKIP